jgi:Mn2+/Fe2+ NRAMP family transporter
VPDERPTEPRSSIRRAFRALGPGILFAGAAIGVSHLVQATRAGAEYGLSLLGLVLLAHALKLPAMLFGPRYAAATGTSLLQGYRRQGPHAIGVFALITLGTMFTIQAAVTVVTASIVRAVLVVPFFGEGVPLWGVAAGVLALCAGLIAAGGFGWLDRALKALMAVMAVSTLVAAGLEAPSLSGETLGVLPVIPDDAAGRTAMLAFCVALVGWMPAPLDISVWHSLWTLARGKQTRHAPSRRECEIDFGVGYALCVVLAIGFVVLGAGELHGTGADLAPSAGAFATQLIDLYTASIGPWVRPLIAACAIAVMFSTTLTVLDALPRTIVVLLARFRTDEAPQAAGPATRDLCRTPGYWAVLAVVAAGALIIIGGVRGAGFRRLIDLATTLSFLGTPLLAWFNHKAMVSEAVDAAHRPGRGMLFWSRLGIAFWAVFAAVFVWGWLAD